MVHQTENQARIRSSDFGGLTNASTYPTEATRLAEMLDVADSDKLGLKVLQTLVKLSGANHGRLQGDWEIHHIPKTWLWDRVESPNYTVPWPAGGKKDNQDRVPCIPLPGHIYDFGPLDPVWIGYFKREALIPYHNGVNGRLHKSLMAQLGEIRGDSRLTAQEMLQRYQNIYRNGEFRKTPMKKVFKFFINNSLPIGLHVN